MRAHRPGRKHFLSLPPRLSIAASKALVAVRSMIGAAVQLRIGMSSGTLSRLVVISSPQTSQWTEYSITSPHNLSGTSREHAKRSLGENSRRPSNLTGKRDRFIIVSSN